MLQAHLNPATHALEIAWWSPGDWTLPVVTAATRIEGSGWSVTLTDPEAYLGSLGFEVTDQVVLYEVDAQNFRDCAPDCEIRWESDAARAYQQFQRIFAERWDTEGIDPAGWDTIWSNTNVDRQVSGISFREAGPIGLILAEYAADPIGIDAPPGRFYRTFGVLPELRGTGAGLALYRESLRRAADLGVERCRWVCFASNRPIERLMLKLGATAIDSRPFYRAPLPLRGGAAGWAS